MLPSHLVKKIFSLLLVISFATGLQAKGYYFESEIDEANTARIVVSVLYELTHRYIHDNYPQKNKLELEKAFRRIMQSYCALYKVKDDSQDSYYEINKLEKIPAFTEILQEEIGGETIYEDTVYSPSLQFNKQSRYLSYALKGLLPSFIHSLKDFSFSIDTLGAMINDEAHFFLDASSIDTSLSKDKTEGALLVFSTILACLNADAIAKILKNIFKEKSFFQAWKTIKNNFEFSEGLSEACTIFIAQLAYKITFMIFLFIVDATVSTVDNNVMFYKEHKIEQCRLTVNRAWLRALNTWVGATFNGLVRYIVLDLFKPQVLKPAIQKGLHYTSGPRKKKRK